MYFVYSLWVPLMIRSCTNTARLCGQPCLLSRLDTATSTCVIGRCCLVSFLVDHVTSYHDHIISYDGWLFVALAWRFVLFSGVISPPSWTGGLLASQGAADGRVSMIGDVNKVGFDGNVSLAVACTLHDTYPVWHAVLFSEETSFGVGNSRSPRGLYHETTMF